MARRTYWRAPDLSIKNEPLIKSLIEYRLHKDRIQVSKNDANLVSSLTENGTHMPILDLDFPHRVGPSTTPGHTHLYLDVEMTKRQLMWLMFGLWKSGIIETGFFIWTLRRGANFARLPGVSKKPGPETDYPEYGWLFKLRKKKS